MFVREEVQKDGDVKIYNPWNPRNRVIPDSEVLRILKSFGITRVPKDMTLFRQACVHKSYVDRPEGPPISSNGSSEKIVIAKRPADCLPLQKLDNEEIEFLGDSFVGCTTARYLIDRYSGQGEGFMTTLRTKIVNNKNLGELCKKIGLDQWLVMSRHVEDVCHGRNNLRMLAGMVEAWMGALFLDTEATTELPEGAAYVAVKTWFICVIEEFTDFAKLICVDTNFKDQLLKYYQAEYHKPPQYREVHVEGPLHDRIFTMGVVGHDGSIVATATSRNKRVAEQEASFGALKRLGVLE